MITDVLQVPNCLWIHFPLILEITWSLPIRAFIAVLPNRTNIIVTRNKEYQAENCIVKNNIIDAINISKSNNEKETFIIGGGEIYKLALELNVVDRIYLTRVHHKFDGDTFFPYLEKEKWKEIGRSIYKKDEKHKYDFTFLTYEKNI